MSAAAAASGCILFFVHLLYPCCGWVATYNYSTSMTQLGCMPAHVPAVGCASELCAMECLSVEVTRDQLWLRFGHVMSRFGMLGSHCGL